VNFDDARVCTLQLNPASKISDEKPLARWLAHSRSVKIAPESWRGYVITWMIEGASTSQPVLGADGAAQFFSRDSSDSEPLYRPYKLRAGIFWRRKFPN